LADTTTINAAVDTLGHLVRVGGALTADVVEFEVKRALEWLETERNEMRRYGATLILKSMADNAPTVRRETSPPEGYEERGLNRVLKIPINLGIVIPSNM